MILILKGAGFVTGKENVFSLTNECNKPDVTGAALVFIMTEIRLVKLTPSEQSEQGILIATPLVSRLKRF